jgi:hypothetical protein
VIRHFGFLAKASPQLDGVLSDISVAAVVACRGVGFAPSNIEARLKLRPRTSKDTTREVNSEATSQGARKKVRQDAEDSKQKLRTTKHGMALQERSLCKDSRSQDWPTQELRRINNEKQE